MYGVLVALGRRERRSGHARKGVPVIHLLYCAAFPVTYLAILIGVGLLLRVDRKPKGGA